MKKLEAVKNAVTSKAGRQILFTKKHSPVLMFGAGVIGVAGTVILACRATLKVEDVLNESDKKRAQLNEIVTPEYSKRDLKKDHVYLSVQTMAQITKLYAPSVALGAVSIGLLTGSHVALTRRNVAATAAYAAVKESFDDYRDRMREEIGEERELELYRGVEERDIHDTKKGIVSKQKYINPGSGPLSPYSALFDQHNQNWNDIPEYNLLFLRSVQLWSNQRLNAWGHLLLNDVFDALGMERTKAGCLVGWVKNNPRNKDADGYIDFGIFDSRAMDRFHSFITGNEPIWLDFNVDGNVYDLI